MATPVSSITVELALSIIAIFVSILSSIWGVLKYGIKLENRLTRLETKTELWWNTVADQVKGVLQQPIHFRKDDLLDRFPCISNQELVELKDIIISEITELKKTKDPKVASYAIWKARVELECLDRSGKFVHVESYFSKFCGYCSNLLWRTK
jgi:hypothetical protein